jgi:hypothetical protein
VWDLNEELEHTLAAGEAVRGDATEKRVFGVILSS